MILSPVAAAFTVDWVVGDPQGSWHPVRLLGRLITWVDIKSARTRMAGLLLALGLPAFCWGLAWLLLRMAGPAAWAVGALIIFFCISGRDMLRHARLVGSALESGDLALARRQVSWIVGRDTAHLDEAGITRACVESVAESFCDGMVAPLFYAWLGGAPLALAYKAVSTLDSMVGYKTERHGKFGWASARLDDLMNFIPARLSAVFVALASLRPFSAMAVALKDGPRQPSPNSGWPEGAFAGALGIQLGGPSSYQGVPSLKATLGSPVVPLNLERARAANGLFFRASLLAALTGELLWHWLKA